VSGRAIVKWNLSKGLTLSKVSAEGIWNSLLFQILRVEHFMKNLQKDPAMIAAAGFRKDGKALAGVGRFDRSNRSKATGFPTMCSFEPLR
jgi:hypothetical protein